MKKNVKGILAVLLTICVVLCLASCGHQNESTQTDQSSLPLPESIAHFADEDGYIYNGYSVFDISRLQVLDESHIKVEPIIIHDDGSYEVNEDSIRVWNYYVYSDEAWEMNDGNTVSYMFKPEYQAEDNSFTFFTSDNQYEWPISLVLMGKTMFEKFAKNGFNSNYLRENFFDDFDSHINFWSSISNDSFEDVDLSQYGTSSNASSGPLNATNCWSQLADEEGYVFGLFDGSFCAMKNNNNARILGFRVRINDDWSYEINYNTSSEFYYEQYDNSVWKMSDGISQEYIYDTGYADKDSQYIMFIDKNDNEDLFLMSKTMFENYVKFSKLCEDGDAEWVETDSIETQIMLWNYIKDGDITKESFASTFNFLD